MNHLKDYCKLALDSYSGMYDETFELKYFGNIFSNTISIIKDEDIIYVVITGTNDIRDWFKNFYFLKKSLGGGIRVHRGFHRGFKQIKNQIKRTLRDNKPKEVVFIGHSLGGALAQLSAYYFSQWYSVSVYSFASPRIGNKAFRDDMNDKVAFNTRVVIDSDFIVSVPKINYCHAGIQVTLPKQRGMFKSHSIDTYYNLLVDKF